MPVGGKVRLKPQVALGVSNRVGVDCAHVGKCSALSRNQHEFHRHEVLANDPQPMVDGQGILGGTDPALDRVLDRNHCGNTAAADDIRERFPHIVDGPPGFALRLRHLRERRLGKRASRPKVAVGRVRLWCWHESESIVAPVLLRRSGCAGVVAAALMQES